MTQKQRSHEITLSIFNRRKVTKVAFSKRKYRKNRQLIMQD